MAIDHYTTHRLHSRKLGSILTVEETAEAAVAVAEAMAQTSATSGVKYLACHRISLSEFVRIAQFKSR